LLLKVETAHSAEVDVQDKAGRPSCGIGGEELLGGGKRGDAEPCATQQAAERPQE
jgi:hypothetical protein